VTDRIESGEKGGNWIEKMKGGDNDFEQTDGKQAGVVLIGKTAARKRGANELEGSKQGIAGFRTAMRGGRKNSGRGEKKELHRNLFVELVRKRETVQKKKKRKAVFGKRVREEVAFQHWQRWVASHRGVKKKKKKKKKQKKKNKNTKKKKNTTGSSGRSIKEKGES